MYKKLIKINGKKYIYYYHNFKVDGKVKNVFLSSNKEEALNKLDKIISKDLKVKIINSNFKEHKVKNFRLFFIFLLAIIGIGVMYYFNPQITGLTVYSNEASSINNLANNFNIKEILGILISLEVLVFGYFIYKDYKNKNFY